MPADVRTLLTGGDVVLADRVVSGGTVVVEEGVIVDVLDRLLAAGPGETAVACPDGYVVPGFVDVHVHGVEGVDALEAGRAIREMAARLPRYGVTAFCPTSIACAPERLAAMLAAVGEARSNGTPGGARVLPAHLESNFINPEFRGAQPGDCLRAPSGPSPDGEFTTAAILDVIARARGDVGIMTVAPEVEGVLPLIPRLIAGGIRVSIGHSGGSYEEAIAAVDAGARHATHLFNRMPPLNHRRPGLTAAVLERSEIDAEIVCDGVHVHHAVVRVAVAAKGASATMAITDGTAGSGLPRGTRTSLGGRPITVADAAYLDDGTLAGSVLTMNRAFAFLVERARLPLPAAAALCATTPARAMRIDNAGVIAPGAAADLVVLDRRFDPMATFRAGTCIWSRPNHDPGGTRSATPPSIRS